jgi:chemotaxis protein MotB
MSDDKSPQWVIKRVKKITKGGHHGGAWKIAYADFVTAMMAFFLLMWLLGSTTKGDLEGIAEFFQTPLLVALAGGSGSGDSSSVIQGGGQDLSRSVGQVQMSDRPTERKIINLQAAQAELARRELERLENLKKRVEEAIEKNPKLTQFRDQIKLEITAEGLQIQVVDELNRPMFDNGRAMLKDYTSDLLRAVGGVLNGVENAISIAGHTDAAPYALGERGYSNWELSTDRANASRRELVAGGMDESKVLRVVGLASSLPLDAANPLDPINRRITLVVLNDKTARAIRGEAEASQVEEAEGGFDAAPVANAPGQAQAPPGVALPENPSVPSLGATGR